MTRAMDGADSVSLSRAALPETKAGETERLEEPAPGPLRPRDYLYHYVPALDSLRSYTLRDFRHDLVAGLTVAAVAVPQAIAYASIVGLAPQYGLYTAIVMTAVGALFDSSRQLINGPTNAISIAVLSALAFVPAENRLEGAILLAFLVGLIQTGITLLRLGDLTRFISHAVIVGFTLGAGVLLVLDQLKHLCGVPAQGDAHEHFLVRFWRTMSHLGQIHWLTLVLGVGTIGMVAVLGWLNRRWRLRVPELLTAVAFMAALVWLFDLERRGVKVTGTIPAAAKLPSLEVPSVRWASVRDLAGSALAIAVLGLLEAIAMAKAIAARTRQKLDINQQALSEGLANLAGSFFQCMPGSGSLTRSNINVQAGAVTQWSGVLCAAAVATTLLLFAPLARYIPRAALAGILIVTAWRLVDRKHLIFHLRTTRFDAGIVLATALSAVVISVEFCILIGVFLSFVLFVPRAAHLHLSRLVLTSERVIRERQAGDLDCDRILIYSLEGELFFGAAADLEKHFEAIARRARNGVRIIVLRLKRVRNPDAVCLELFERFIEQMEQRKLTVLLCGVRPDVARVLTTSGLEARLGKQRIFLETAMPTSSTLDAVRHAYDLLAGDLCATCPRRGEQNKEVLYYMI